MLKIPYAGYPGLSPAISSQFSLKICITAQNREKFTKSLFWGFKVIDVDTPRKLVTSACYDKQDVCACLQLFSC